MTRWVGAKGQIVIPKDLRERAGLYPGAEVDFDLEGERVVLSRHRSAPHLGGRFAGSGMADRLIEERANEPR